MPPMMNSMAKRAPVPGQPQSIPGSSPMTMPTTPPMVRRAPPMGGRFGPGVALPNGAAAPTPSGGAGLLPGGPPPGSWSQGKMNQGGIGVPQIPPSMPRGPQEAPLPPGAPAPMKPGPVDTFGGGAGGAAGGMGDLDKFYQDLLADDAASWEKKQGELGKQMAGFQRRGDIMAARMGHNMGGGYASIAGAALGQGMRAYNEADLAHGDRRRQMQLAYLEEQLRDKRRTEERGWQKDDMADSERQKWIDRYIELEGHVPSDEELDAFMGGNGKSDKQKEDDLDAAKDKAGGIAEDLGQPNPWAYQAPGPGQAASDYLKQDAADWENDPKRRQAALAKLMGWSSVNIQDNR